MRAGDFEDDLISKSETRELKTCMGRQNTYNKLKSLNHIVLKI